MLTGGPAARLHRWHMFAERFPGTAELRILDLGGEAAAWLSAPLRPRQVVLLNVPWQAELQQKAIAAAGASDWLAAVPGDACAPPAEITARTFDLVYSNSVIEHVGGHSRRAAFAETATGLAERHWVQTPSRYFPLEPHWFCPGFQFFPVRARAMLMRRWPFGNYAGLEWTFPARVAEVLSIELLSATEVRHYFPASELVRERAFGLTKSLIAVRG